MVNRLIKKAPWFGAFFMFMGLWQASQLTYAASCIAPDKTESVQIRQITDGDTLILRDNRRVRLIGINTPELGRDGKPDQALAIRARSRLKQLLFQANNKASLQIGDDPRDRYGRTLAYVWLANGQEISEILLREGLGWMIAIPPNLAMLECHLKAEQIARTAKAGVWSHPNYEPIPATKLSLRDTGYQRVRGRISSVNNGGGARWINLQNRLTIRIQEKNLHWFNNPPNRSWIGREIEVGGWLYQVKGKLRVNLSHPSALQIRPGS